MKTKKVLHIFNSINHSGAEVMFCAIAEQYKNHGYSLLALSTGDKKGTYTNKFIEAGFTIFHLPFSKKYSIKWYVKFIPHFVHFYKLLKRNNITFVHIHKRHLFWIYATIAKMAGVKKIVRTIHNVFVPVFYRFHAYFLARHYSKLIGVKMVSISDSVFANEKKRFLNNTVKIFNWYNEKQFYPVTSDTEKLQMRHKLGISENSFVLITVGSCIAQKNHKFLLNVISKLNVNRKIEYLHIGDGVLLPEEKQLAKDFNIDKIVHFIGRKNNIRDYLIAADLYLMPSVYEGFGVALIEAMACKTPVIASYVSGLKDFFSLTGTNIGLLLELDTETFVNHIQRCVAKPELLAPMANAAYQFVSKEFTSAIGAQKYIELYEA